MFPETSYCHCLDQLPDIAEDIGPLAKRVFRQVFRCDFQQPGFSLIRFSSPVASKPLRRFMVRLKQVLDAEFCDMTGRHLAYLSMGRFDQQDTTKFHLDGAPDESFLMLGYEPSDVPSQLAMADYSRAAFDLGIEPKQFLTDYNPMFSEGARLLGPYVTNVTCFQPDAAQVVIVNNSSLSVVPGLTNMLGVMHQATIPQLLPHKKRVVNSTMIGVAPSLADELVPPASQQTFQESDAIARKGYA